MALPFNQNGRFLFVGDELTDCGRFSDPEEVGQGYVRMIRDYLRARHAPTAPHVLNRGVAGAPITELASRWEKDVLAERPDMISIQLEPTDANRGAGHQGGGMSVDQYRSVYRQMLVQTKERLPRCRLVLCEPAGLWTNAPAEMDEKLHPFRDTVNALASEFGAQCVVPLHSAFVFARNARRDIQWTTDKLQPTSAGHMLIAFTWLEENEMVRREFT